MHDLYPSKEALDGALASGSVDGTPETLDQLDELLVHPGRERGTVMKSWLSRSASSLSILAANRYALRFSDVACLQIP